MQTGGRTFARILMRALKILTLLALSRISGPSFQRVPVLWVSQPCVEVVSWTYSAPSASSVMLFIFTT